MKLSSRILMTKVKCQDGLQTLFTILLLKPFQKIVETQKVIFNTIHFATNTVGV